MAELNEIDGAFTHVLQTTEKLAVSIAVRCDKCKLLNAQLQESTKQVPQQSS